MAQSIRNLARFLLTIKFGVVLILVLMAVMMFATQFEASYGTRAMKRYVYGSVAFDIGVFLFVVNIVVNTLRRRPYRWRHTGFLVVHAGVLTIVAGGLMTRWFGIDGTMPIAEGDTSRKISLPDNDLVVTAGGRTVRHSTDYDILPGEEVHDDLYEVPGTPYLLHVSRYYPSAAVADTLIDDGAEPNPIVQVAVGGAAAPVSEWLVARDPAHSSFLAGDVRVTFAESGMMPSIRERWAQGRSEAAPAAPASAHAGHLRLFWTDGSSELVHVPGDAREPLRTSRQGVVIEVEQVFRSFTLTAEGHADAFDKPDNPAISFRVRAPHGIEEHFSFTAFPEFRLNPPDGEEWVLSHAFWEPELGAGGESQRLEVAIERQDAGRFATWTSWGDATDGSLLAVAETRSFADRGVMLRILQAAERGRLTSTVRKVSDEVIRPVVKVAVVRRDESSGLAVASVFDVLRGRVPVRPAEGVTPAEAWVFHGESYRFETAEGPIEVRYEGRSIPLDFGVHLNDFREETYPGIMLAASYESHVVVEPADAEPFETQIYMNHPLIYAGYTFYQASFQRTQSGEEITVLSVARDPGMTVSFVGYCILVLGLVLIFFVKPYFRRLDDRIARSRTAAQGA